MIDYDLWTKNISYSAFSALAIYKLNDVAENFLPFAGLGYTKNNFDITIDYGKVVINDYGGQLESVKVDGGTEGLIAETGFEIPMGMWCNFGLYLIFIS